MSAVFTSESRIRDVLALGERGRGLLFEHGYDAGEGFVDVLSQYQRLWEAQRAGRLRDLDGLIVALNAVDDADARPVAPPA